MKHSHFRGAAFLIVISILAFAFSSGFARQPEYAQWGKTAVEETAKKYPGWNLTEYEYDGKVFISDNREQFNFKFVLENENQQKKDVLVYVLVNKPQNKLIDVYFDELQDLS
ncbi:YqzG/YhdC family protein [Halobacillus salinarum]|uniref:YqzG/YhdC family protein n=1 Tax=Halobacillus salinarum TaxID=2932257 RepID=A0ABY4EI00_9BACI|nr:DUF3889 domain-containing protein [Halobacillus salinarum]UOQ43693.1 YqzG/YhdC family protein [Halobacillus salinarum]